MVGMNLHPQEKNHPLSFIHHPSVGTWDFRVFCYIVFAMVLSREELQSLVEARHRSPHQLLGMHPLGDGAGVIARALIPEAAKVEIAPVHENQMPAIELRRLGVKRGEEKRKSAATAPDQCADGTLERTGDSGGAAGLLGHRGPLPPAARPHAG